MSIVPKTYQQWRHCIEVECGIPLAQPYIGERIAALDDASDHYTQQFAKVWGPKHLLQVRQWFEQAGREMSGPRSAG